jgi:hypothetical protein
MEASMATNRQHSSYPQACAWLYANQAKAGGYLILEVTQADEDGQRKRMFTVADGPLRELLSPMKLALRCAELAEEEGLDDEDAPTLHQLWFDSLMAYPTNLDLREVMAPEFFADLSMAAVREWEEIEVFPRLRMEGAANLDSSWSGPNERTIKFTRRLARHVTDSVMEATNVPFNYTYRVIV